MIFILFYNLNNYGYDDIISLKRAEMLFSFNNGVSSGSGDNQGNRKSISLIERVRIMFNIDLQSRTPIYEQLYKKILELILKQDLKANDKLPSVRELAKDLGVNPNTVSKAFQMLERDKVIYSLAGRGSFVANIETVALKETALTDFDNAAKEALTAGITKSELIERIDKIDV